MDSTNQLNSNSAETSQDELDQDELDIDDGFIDVTCPGCNARLTDETTFETHRICPSCGRHFWLPARERLAMVVDPDSFRETNGEIVSVDPLVFQDVRRKSGETSNSEEEPENSISNALVTGIARIGGCQAVVIVADFAMVGDAIGIVAGEKIVLAIETAASKRLPLLTITSDGPSGAGNETVSALQSLRITNALARLRSNGRPYIAVLSHPSTGALYQGLASHADITLAEPGTHIGNSSVQINGAASSAATAKASEVLESGGIDAIVVRSSLRSKLTTLLDVLTRRAAPRASAESVASSLSQLSASEEQAIARHADRPGPDDFADRILSGFVELHGDRISSDDQGIRIGIAQVDGVSVGAILYGDSSSTNEDNTERSNITAGSLRKAERLYRLAAMVELPVLAIVGSGKLAPALGVEGATIGESIARLAESAARHSVPTITVIVSEIGGLAAATFAIADHVLILEHAVLTQTRDSAPLPISGTAATPKKRRVMTARDLQRVRLAHTVVPEPAGGAHTDPAAAAQEVRLAISHSLAELSGVGPRHRRDDRSRHLRDIGLTGTISADHMKLELAHLQDIQRAVNQSILDFRDRVDSYNRQIPVLLQLPDRRGMPNLSREALPVLPSVKRPGVNRPELAEIRTRLNSKRKGISDKLSEVREAKTGKSGNGDNANHPSDDPAGSTDDLAS